MFIFLINGLIFGFVFDLLFLCEGMGMTLTLDDLKGAMAMPKELISGFVLQYSVSFLSIFMFALFKFFIVEFE